MINKSTELEVDKICRSCMCQNDNMRNVFDSKEHCGKTLQFAEMFTACTTVEISEEDGLPHLLCANCEHKLIIAYDFKQQSQNSDAALKKIINQTKSGSLNEESLNGAVTPLCSETESDEDEETSSEKQPTSFPCGFCQKVLRTEKGWIIHERRHTTGENLQTCQMCQAQFVRFSLLLRHIQNIHLRANAALNFCEICGSFFDDVNALDLHKKTHANKIDESITINSVEQSSAEHSSENEIIVVEGEGNDGNNKAENEKIVKDKVDKNEVQRLYECEYCFKLMNSFIGLQIHLQQHATNILQCDFCDKTFTSDTNLKRHLQIHGIADIITTKSISKQVMECEFCDRKFKYRKSFNHHMETEHGLNDESDSPPVISFIVEEEKQVDPPETESITITTEPAEREEDPFATIDKSEESDPLEEAPTLIAPKTSNIMHTCHVCEAVFTRGNHLTRHMTLHRALLVHKCERCAMAFATEEHLSKHVEEEHINKPYVCTICNRPFGRGEHLIRHLKVHQNTEEDDEDMLKCCICEKTFARPEHLASHIKVHVLQDKRHICAQCGKAFNRLDNLKTHQRIHTAVKDNIKLHLCIYCGKEFNNSSNMIVHMRRHTGERPYKCSVCGKGFPRSHDLKCHERTHSGEKPYQCNVCGKSFNKSNKLLRHMRVHTGERPYVCNICSRAFTQSNDLALHMRRHTGARPYVCGMCPARFIQSGQLKAHRRSSGHWMETQPDLKGGHRVEPVHTLLPPVPIRFKTHKPKTTVLEEIQHIEANEENDQQISLMAMEGESAMLIDPKIVEFQPNALINIVQTSDIKCDNETTYVVTTTPSPSIKLEEQIDKDNVANTATVTFQEEAQATATSVTYSIVTPLSASFPAAEYGNYQNY